MTTKHKTGTREEWRTARLQLLDAEKELTRRSDEVARQRQALPWVRVEKDYRFETDQGPASLADLSWVLNDPAGPVDVLALSATNALETGEQAVRTGSRDLVALEVAQIVVEAADSPMVVMTYEPVLYKGCPVRVMDMRPR